MTRPAARDAASPVAHLGVILLTSGLLAPLPAWADDGPDPESPPSEEPAPAGPDDGLPAPDTSTAGEPAVDPPGIPPRFVLHVFHVGFDPAVVGAGTGLLASVPAGSHWSVSGGALLNLGLLLVVQARGSAAWHPLGVDRGPFATAGAGLSWYVSTGGTVVGRGGLGWRLDLPRHPLQGWVPVLDVTCGGQVLVANPPYVLPTLTLDLGLRR